MKEKICTFMVCIKYIAAYDDISLISVYCHLQLISLSQSSRLLLPRRISSSQSPRLSSPSFETTDPILSRKLHIHYHVHMQFRTFIE